MKKKIHAPGGNQPYQRGDLIRFGTDNIYNVWKHGAADDVLWISAARKR